MKKFASVVLALVALLAFAVSPVLAASGVLTLRETRNDRGGGVIFIFEYTGDFTGADFDGGSVLMNGQYYPLDCNIAEGVGEVWCTASRALAGEQVQVFLAGSTFWDKVPERSGFGGICYNVFDDPTEGQPDAWIFQGEHCQEEPASQGDMITFYSPYWASYYDYFFEANGLEWNSGGPSTNPGEGYYYDNSEEVTLD